MFYNTISDINWILETNMNYFHYILHPFSIKLKLGYNSQFIFWLVMIFIYETFSNWKLQFYHFKRLSHMTN